MAGVCAFARQRTAALPVAVAVAVAAAAAAVVLPAAVAVVATVAAEEGAVEAATAVAVEAVATTDAAAAADVPAANAASAVTVGIVGIAAIAGTVTTGAAANATAASDSPPQNLKFPSPPCGLRTGAFWAKPLPPFSILSENPFPFPNSIPCMIPKLPLDRINWVSSIFLIVTFFTALIGTPIYIYHFGIDFFQIALFVFYFIATGMSITLGYHRLFAHKAFKAGKTVKLTTLLFGASAFEDSALDWASDHREHHKHVDHEDDDPYSISRGFFWAHMGWIFFKLYPRPLANVADLKKDPLVMWQHKHHQHIGFAVGLILPTVLGFLYGGWVSALGAFLIAGVTRLVCVQHCTFLINSLCHTIGNRPYDSGTSARDSWLMAIPTFGEGYHNYHHSFQHDYRNGVKPWQWDPTKWAIWTLSKLGLVTELRRVPEEKIVLAELREMKMRAEAQIATGTSWKIPCPTREEAYATLVELSDQLSTSYVELEKAVSGQIKISGEKLQHWRAVAAEVGAQLSRMRTLQPAMA